MLVDSRSLALVTCGDQHDYRERFLVIVPSRMSILSHELPENDGESAIVPRRCLSKRSRLFLVVLLVYVGPYIIWASAAKRLAKNWYDLPGYVFVPLMGDFTTLLNNGVILFYYPLLLIEYALCTGPYPGFWSAPLMSLS